MLRMHKKTRNPQFNHITDKAENNKRIKRNEENVCVCLDAGWCMVSTFKRLEIAYTFLCIEKLNQK